MQTKARRFIGIAVTVSVLAALREIARRSYQKQIAVWSHGQLESLEPPPPRSLHLGGTGVYVVEINGRLVRYPPADRFFFDAGDAATVLDLLSTGIASREVSELYPSWFWRFDDLIIGWHAFYMTLPGSQEPWCQVAFRIEGSSFSLHYQIGSETPQESSYPISVNLASILNAAFDKAEMEARYLV